MTPARDILLSHHCVERFHERFRPAVDQIAARRELEALIAHGEIAGEPPDWMARTMRQEAEAYLIVGEDLVLPLVSIGLGDVVAIAKTCIARVGSPRRHGPIATGAAASGAAAAVGQPGDDAGSPPSR